MSASLPLVVTGMKRVLLGLFLSGVAGFLLLRSMSVPTVTDRSTTPADHVDQLPSARPLASSVPEAVAVASPEPQQSEPADPRLVDQIRAQILDQRLQERSREVERERRAKRRFDRALAESGLTAADVDPAVRDLFRRMELSSVVDGDGMLLGLRIEALDADSPLRTLGFLPGDRIERIDNVVLHDPGELPQLLASLSRRVRVCAVRPDEEICADVEL